MSDNIIQLPSTKIPTWRQQANRLHDEGRDEFRQVCHVARLCAQRFSFPRDNSFFAMIDNMELIKNSSFDFNFAIDTIEEIYNDVYHPPKADIISFPMEVSK